MSDEIISYNNRVKYIFSLIIDKSIENGANDRVNDNDDENFYNLIDAETSKLDIEVFEYIIYKCFWFEFIKLKFKKIVYDFGMIVENIKAETAINFMTILDNGFEGNGFRMFKKSDLLESLLNCFEENEKIDNIGESATNHRYKLAKYFFLKIIDSYVEQLSEYLKK